MNQVIFTGNFTLTQFDGEFWAEEAELQLGDIYSATEPTGDYLRLEQYPFCHDKNAFTVLDFLDYEVRGCVDTGEEILSNVDNPTFWTLYGLREETTAPIWEAIFDYPTEEAAKTILNKLK